MRAEVLPPEEQIMPQCVILGVALLATFAISMILRKYEDEQTRRVGILTRIAPTDRALWEELRDEVMSLREELKEARRAGAAIVLPAKPANGSEPDGIPCHTPDSD